MEYTPKHLREIGDILGTISELDNKLRDVSLASNLPVLDEDGAIIGHLVCVDAGIWNFASVPGPLYPRDREGLDHGDDN